MNAQLAVDLYTDVVRRRNLNSATAWHGIGMLLLSCEIYRRGWRKSHRVIKCVDSKRLRANASLRRARRATAYLAKALGIPECDVCENIGLYWQQPNIRLLQPHNLAGHAFRSLVATALHLFGDTEIDYEEQIERHEAFPGQSFQKHGVKTKIDILARRRNRAVALISAHWGIRHYRACEPPEALAYLPVLRRENPRGQFYAVVGEFDGGRLRKLLASSEPQAPNAAISGAVHFAPELIREGLGENGSLEHLRSLEWLIRETFRWD